MSTNLLGLTIKDRYKLIDERGNGSFGTVYIARDLHSNYLYAAKIMHLDHAYDSELLERFKREAYILQSLNDPHIVRIVDYGNDNNIYFIVMHHVDGQNLKYHIVTDGPMEPLRALNYIIQAAEGLEAAYRRGVVHRDIKPQNILVSNKGVVKIADFGLSRSNESPTITGSDKFMGTAYYSAPEQVMRGHSADTRSDLYSLAVVLFEVLAGRPPYTGGTAVDPHRPAHHLAAAEQEPHRRGRVLRLHVRAVGRQPRRDVIRTWWRSAGPISLAPAGHARGQPARRELRDLRCLVSRPGQPARRAVGRPVVAGQQHPRAGGAIPPG